MNYCKLWILAILPLVVGITPALSEELGIELAYHEQSSFLCEMDEAGDTRLGVEKGASNDEIRKATHETETRLLNCR